MQNRISLHADCHALGSNRQLFIDFVVALRPPYVLLMDDDDCKVSDEIHARSPETTIVHRKFNVHEGKLWDVAQNDGTTLTPQEYLDYLKTHQRPYLVHNVMNEPAPPKGEIIKGLKWLCELMKLAFEQKMRLCVLNMQSVAMRQDEIDAGVYDEFALCCARYASYHIVGFHEYALADIPYNISATRMDILAKTYRPGYIPTWSDVIPREAHIGRIQCFVNRMQLIGATPLPDFIATEYGLDKVEIGQYQAVIGLNGGAIPYGLPSLEAYYQRCGSTVKDSAIRQFKWTNVEYPAYVKAFMWFAWNYNPEWAGFNVAQLTDLQREWIIYADRLRTNQIPPTTPTPPPTVPALSTDARIAALEADMGKLEAKLGL